MSSGTSPPKYGPQRIIANSEKSLYAIRKLPIGEIAKEEIANKESRKIGSICIVHQVLPITHQVELKNKIPDKHCKF